MNSKYKNDARRRYYLHWKIRKQGFELKTEEKTILYNDDMVLSPQVQTLAKDYGYNLQTFIK